MMLYLPCTVEEMLSLLQHSFTIHNYMVYVTARFFFLFRESLIVFAVLVYVDVVHV